jgi:hypothetical protein
MSTSWTQPAIVAGREKLWGRRRQMPPMAGAIGIQVRHGSLFRQIRSPGDDRGTVIEYLFEG